MPDTSYTPKVYKNTNGDKMVVASGGVVDIESGGALQIAGSDRTAVLATAPGAVAAGYKIARGEVTLDGGNPTPIVTGLATVVACAVTLKAAATPGDDPTSFSVDYAGAVTAGTVNLYAYKTNGTDPTLVASTDSAAVVSWIAVGT